MPRGFIFFGKSLIKPKKTVKLKISPERIELHLNGEQNTVDLKDLKHLYLNYMDYGSWSTHSIYGNKITLESQKSLVNSMILIYL